MEKGTNGVKELYKKRGGHPFNRSSGKKEENLKDIWQRGRKNKRRVNIRCD